ncbi:Phosphatidylinositol 3-kinase, root isoform [Dichanthelium oligosanthes]|uniref:phosphatidylinositol 3-kinase n=1 Tax=Dichanthelium oligosanthes TaxID=888268 RepID=A0A1E5VFC9_9POAL|nr:Phosphatidylinositol 3-kinase, root isoform [Dichanthelium oligosanthes]
MVGGGEFRFFLSCDISLPLAFRVLQAGRCVSWSISLEIIMNYFVVWDVSSGEDPEIVGGATIFLFNSKRQLKTGRQKLRLWPKMEADGGVPTTTPGKVPKNERGEIERLERLVNRYERGQIQHVDWLDRLAFSAMEKAKEKQCERKANLYPSLVVELCSFEHRVVFQESGANFYTPAPVSLSNELVTVWDPELGRTNPSEHKQLKLARSLTRGIVDRDLKPSSNERKLLQTIIKFPPTRTLEVDEKQLVWKFRFSLMSEKKALTKFVRSVDWSDNQNMMPEFEKARPPLVITELRVPLLLFPPSLGLLRLLLRVGLLRLLPRLGVRERAVPVPANASSSAPPRARVRLLLAEARRDLELAAEVDAPPEEAKQAVELIGKWEMIDVADALELLSPDFESDEVRGYAVSVLERADDEELQCYLLQLVQALRFERSDKSRLALFLVNRALSNIEIASFLRWYILVELHSPAYARRYYGTYDMLENSMMKLVGREDGDEDGFRLWQSLTRQTDLTAQLCSIMKDVRNVRGSAQKKIEKLRQLLSGVFSELTNFDEPIRSPLAPTLLLTGVVPQESSIFKSALNPLRLTFKTANGGTYKIIYKKGDDLRQDQLVIQTVSLMDRLLKLENLDLHLTPYRVLATGQDEGMLEFIPSSSLAQILSEHRSITSYLQKFHPDEDGPFGITAQCLETFIKSCAGYSVITYILGVGDRHLDNLLLTDDGRLFHVDFAFILGRDPKPFPPPMKLCKEMVEAMGGAESQYYTRFKSYCCEAYNILRKSSSLILNLFKLMERSGIPDISADESGGLKVNWLFTSTVALPGCSSSQLFRSGS